MDQNLVKFNLAISSETMATIEHLQEQCNLPDPGAVIMSGIEALRILTLPGVTVTMPENTLNKDIDIRVHQGLQ